MNHYWALGFLCPVEVHIPSDWYAKWQSIGGNWLYLYQQVSTANSFFVGMGLCFYFFVSMLGPLQVLLIHTVTVSVRSYVPWSHCFQKAIFPWAHPSPLALVICLSLQFISLNLEGRLLMKTFYLVLSIQLFCNFCACYIVLIPIYCEKSLLWSRMRKAQS